MKVCIVSNNYPSNMLPNRGAFVYNLVQEFVKGEGNDVEVIAPIKLHEYFSHRKAGSGKSTVYGEELCKVHRPFYISLGNRRIGNINLGKITYWFMQLSVKLCFKFKIKTCDVLYTHFLINAMTVLNISIKNNIPLIVASGESKYRDLTLWNSERLKQLIDRTSHFIAVSEYNKYELLKIGGKDDKITVVPNAVDYERFSPKNMSQCRERFNLPKDKFIIGFIGHFIERKGPNRLIKAVENISDPEMMVVCVGTGKIEEKGFVKVIAPMANDRLPYLINCFDIFVLPTLAEGHCNIIEEVMACGIPVISSKGTSVEGQIDTETGILVDPLNINEIGYAIKSLKTDSLYRNRLHTNLLKRRGQWSLRERAKKINNIIMDTLTSYVTT